MTHPDAPRHIEIRDGDQTIAAAEVMTRKQAARTVRVSLHAVPGHVRPGRRASLVDAVMDLPEVQASARLEASVPLGDTESLERLRQRTRDAVTRPAGCTALVDADLLPHGRPGGDRGQAVLDAGERRPGPGSHSLPWLVAGIPGSHSYPTEHIGISTYGKPAHQLCDAVCLALLEPVRWERLVLGDLHGRCAIALACVVARSGAQGSKWRCGFVYLR